MIMSAQRDFICDIPNLEHVRCGFKIGNERAHTGNPIDIAFIVQLAERTVCGHPGNAG
jgi:hypothetical protein